MTNQQQRELVRRAYPGTKWSKDVDRMSDQQIFVIFLRLRNAGKIKI